MRLRKTRGIERRRYKRISLFCLLKYRRLHTAEAYRETLTSLRNISGGGILFKAKELLAVNTRLEIEINVPPLGGFFVVEAKVVRHEKIRGSRRYWIGAEFVNISDDDRKRIINLAESEG